MQADDFFEMCVCKFRPLRESYDFCVIDRKIERFSWEIFLANSTTGICVSLQLREMCVFVTLCQLINNQFVFHAGEITPDTQLYCFDLEDLVNLRSSTISNGSLCGNIPIESMLEQNLQNLESFSSDVLSGDFSVFEDLDEVVKRRAGAIALDKWGEQASRYGWEGK